MAATNTVAKTIHAQSGVLTEAIEAMCTLRSPWMCRSVSLVALVFMLGLYYK